MNGGEADETRPRRDKRGWHAWRRSAEMSRCPAAPRFRGHFTTWMLSFFLGVDVRTTLDSELRNTVCIALCNGASPLISWTFTLAQSQGFKLIPKESNRRAFLRRRHFTVYKPRVYQCRIVFKEQPRLANGIKRFTEIFPKMSRTILEFESPSEVHDPLWIDLGLDAAKPRQIPTIHFF